MNWITDGKTILFDMVKDGKLLELLGKLDNEKLNALVEKLETNIDALGNVYSEIRNLKSPFELLQLFAKDKDFSKHINIIGNAMNSFGIDTSGLIEVVDKIRSWIDDIPQEYKKLLNPVGDFVEETAGSDPGLVKWQLLQTDKSGEDILSKGVALKLEGMGSASLQLEAGHKSSFSEDDRYLRIGLEAGVDIASSVSIPLNMGSISLGAGAGGKLHLNYLFESDNKNTIYAKAISSSLPALANPLDFDSIWSSMMDYNLSALRVQAEGSAFGTTSIGLAKKAAIPNIAEAAAGLTFDAEIRCGGSYRYDVRRISNSLIELTLASSRETSVTMGMGAKVIIDAKQLAEKIKAEIGDDLSELNSRYKQLDDYLQPGNIIRAEIEKKVKELTSDKTAGQLLKLGFGLTDKKTVETKLTDVIEGAISTRSAVWQARTENGADTILADLIERYPILGEEIIQQQLENGLSKLISIIDNKLKDEVLDIIAGGADDLLDALEASGVTVNRALDKADEALSGVRRALREYHDKIEKILKGLEKYATSEINIEFQAQSTSTSGTGVSLTAQFTTNSLTTQDAYTALLSGNLDKILHLNNTQPDGLTIDLEEWQRFADFNRSSGWNLSVLDISLGGETLFSTKSRVSIDDDGVIGILSDGEWTRRRRAYKESREFGFVDAYRLLVAKQTRSLNANIKLSQEDENTERKELSDFLSHLEKYGLVRNGTGAAAEKLLARWQGEAGDTDIKTNIAAKLRLTSVEVQSLIGINAEPAKLRDEFFVKLAYNFLKKVGFVTQDDINLAIPALRGLPGVNADELSPTELIAKYTPGHCREWVMRDQLDSDVIDALREIESLHDKAIALKRMMLALRNIWLADPQKPDIDEGYYRSQQKVVDRSLQEWVKIGSKFIFWLSNKTHRSTIAFLLCITFLSDIRGRSPMIVTISRDNGENLILP